ncbi:trypsin-like serine protease [Phytohabitans sp. ZYX-F-186]|uniref:Trypsin-like serine protease n=1 Tax=Phytohabitans maris TaxID=3071409 RepID=A0ABU0ZKM6_9ACTN|nr:trypsin-like serine protease [Phytohabitans sp. ZYX-F-186]MDQ7907590.1 trypsin-like serine protease [Phytohabitans sp. ZYX-F-186]
MWTTTLQARNLVTSRLFNPRTAAAAAAAAAAAVAGSAALWMVLSWPYPRPSGTQRWQVVLAGLLVGTTTSIVGGGLAGAVASGNRTALRWWGRAGRTLPVVAMVTLVLAMMAACGSRSRPGDGVPRLADSLLVSDAPSGSATQSYPAMANLIKPKQGGDRHARGAALVWRTHVLTAAHCVTDQAGTVEDHTGMQVRIRSAQWRTGGLATTVAAVEVFGAWRGDALHWPDRSATLALLRLAATVRPGGVWSWSVGGLAPPRHKEDPR